MIIEHRTFRLVEGADEAEFLVADKAMQEEFAPFQVGFVRRTTARAEDTWLVETFWYETANADAALAADHPVVAAFDAFVDLDTQHVARFATLE